MGALRPTKAGAIRGSLWFDETRKEMQWLRGNDGKGKKEMGNNKAMRIDAHTKKQPKGGGG